MADVLIKEWDIGAMRRPASSAPARSLTSGSNFPWDALNFAPGVDQVVYVFGVMPEADQYAAGQDVKVEFDWISDGSTTGVVRWKAELLGRTDGEAWDVAFTDSGTVDDARTAANALHRASVTLSSPALAPKDSFILKLSRNGSHGNDSYTADANMTKARLLAA
jgi:glucose dehydrogenase